VRLGGFLLVCGVPGFDGGWGVWVPNPEQKIQERRSVGCQSGGFKELCQRRWGRVGGHLAADRERGNAVR
jgi:hypothetical protein